MKSLYEQEKILFVRHADIAGGRYISLEKVRRLFGRDAAQYAKNAVIGWCNMGAYYNLYNNIPVFTLDGFRYVLQYTWIMGIKEGRHNAYETPDYLAMSESPQEGKGENMENKATREFEELMDGMVLKLPAGLYFDNTAIECIKVMVTLKQLGDLAGMKKKELYSLYLGCVKRMYDEKAESVFTEKGFKEFLKSWPEVLECHMVYI